MPTNSSLVAVVLALGFLLCAAFGSPPLPWMVPVLIAVVVLELRAALRARDAALAIVRPVHFVFDGPPSADCPRFIEVETLDGRSLNVGTWKPLDGGRWALEVCLA